MYSRGPSVSSESRGEKRPQPEPETQPPPVTTAERQAIIPSANVQPMLIAALIGALLILFVYKGVDHHEG